METQGSTGGRAVPSCNSSMEMPSGERTKAMRPSRGGRNFGHLAYKVDDIHAACRRLMDGGVVINRPPRDGRMAFVRSPDGISIELLQEGTALPPVEPWVSMPNTGSW
jgi:lactoylglutathione lyase